MYVCGRCGEHTALVRSVICLRIAFHIIWGAHMNMRMCLSSHEATAQQQQHTFPMMMQRRRRRRRRWLSAYSGVGLASAGMLTLPFSLLLFGCCAVALQTETPDDAGEETPSCRCRMLYFELARLGSSMCVLCEWRVSMGSIQRYRWRHNSTQRLASRTPSSFTPYSLN